MFLYISSRHKRSCGSQIWKAISMLSRTTIVTWLQFTSSVSVRVYNSNLNGSSLIDKVMRLTIPPVTSCVGPVHQLFTEKENQSDYNRFEMDSEDAGTSEEPPLENG
jgi:hypothetical protein